MGVSKGYKEIYNPDIFMNCTSKEQDRKCGKFPIVYIYNLS